MQLQQPNPFRHPLPCPAPQNAPPRSAGPKQQRVQAFLWDGHNKHDALVPLRAPPGAGSASSKRWEEEQAEGLAGSSSGSCAGCLAGPASQSISSLTLRKRAAWKQEVDAPSGISGSGGGAGAGSCSGGGSVYCTSSKAAAQEAALLAAAGSGVRVGPAGRRGQACEGQDAAPVRKASGSFARSCDLAHHTMGLRK